MRAVKPNDVHYFLGDFCLGSQTRSPCLSATNSLHEDLRGARKSRQAGAQVERGILFGSTIWLGFRSTVTESCFVTTPCASGTAPIVDHGTSMDVLQRRRTHSPWMWESTRAISVRGVLTKSRN